MLGYHLIRINPDKIDFNDYEEFGRVSAYIAESIKKQTGKSTKNSLIDDLSKRLLELEFKSNHSIKSKCLKWVAKKNTANNKRHKNTQSRITPIKTTKKIGAAYCLRCKDYTHKFKPQEIKMTNKMLREKSNCVVCPSSKSRFQKQKHSNKK